MSLIQVKADRRCTNCCAAQAHDVVRARYNTLRQALPSAEIYYAVKANPAPEIISTVAALGADFNLASLGKLDICPGLNIPPKRLSFCNTIKRESAVWRASGDGWGLHCQRCRRGVQRLSADPQLLCVTQCLKPVSRCTLSGAIAQAEDVGDDVCRLLWREDQVRHLRVWGS